MKPGGPVVQAWAYWRAYAEKTGRFRFSHSDDSTSSCRYSLAIVFVDNAFVYIPQSVAGRLGVPNRPGRQLHLDTPFRRSGRLDRRSERHRGGCRHHYEELWPRPAVGGAVSRMGRPRCRGRSRPILSLSRPGLGTDPRPITGHSDAWRDRPCDRAVGRAAAGHFGGGAGGLGDGPRHHDGGTAGTGDAGLLVRSGHDRPAWAALA